MTMSKKIIFFGNERLATGTTTNCIIASSLLKAGFEIAAIVINKSEIASRQAQEIEIETFAKKHDIPVYSPKTVSSIIDDLKKYNAPLAVLVAYGKIIPEKVISLFPRGIVNVHPSLLPLHRGPTPIESTILGGDKKTGVSIMQLVKEMDAGPVYAQKSIDLEETISKQDLCDQLSEMGAKLLLDCLPKIIDNSLEPINQDERRATYDQKILKSSSSLTWNKPTIQILREIRAFYGWPGSKTIINDIEITIINAHSSIEHGNPGTIFIAKDKSLGIYTNDGAIIIDILKPAGKKSMGSPSFINGYLKNL